MTVVVLTGPAGSGKSTIAAAVAERLGWAFGEGDDLHPPANITAMRTGRPLTDADRDPWLTRLGEWIDQRLAAGENAVLTCSALRRRYRDRLRRPGVLLVYLQVDPATLAARLAARQGHFLPPALLGSQLAALEEPGSDEDVVVVDGTAPDVIDRVVAVARGQASGADASSQDTKPV